ncbi:MAG: hypothetical protein Q9M92_17785 [Enterobacterales bacterium]|nr:hypothetical protein [Enterobacterales bacterium]
MFDMLLNSITLFMKGKLFQDLGSLSIKLSIGIIVTAVICFAAFKLGLNIWFAIAIASIVGGAIQPYLFKDLKYK